MLGMKGLRKVVAERVGATWNNTLPLRTRRSGPLLLRCRQSAHCNSSAGLHVVPRSHHDLGFIVASLRAASSTSAGLLTSCPSRLVLVAALLAAPCSLDEMNVALPNRSPIRLAGRKRQGPPRRRNVPPPRALDAASAHRCRSTPARDGYARRNNGSTSGQRSAVATDISACSVV